MLALTCFFFGSVFGVGANAAYGMLRDKALYERAGSMLAVSEALVDSVEDARREAFSGGVELGVSMGQLQTYFDETGQAAACASVESHDVCCWRLGSR